MTCGQQLMKVWGNQLILNVLGLTKVASNLDSYFVKQTTFCTTVFLDNRLDFFEQPL